MDRKARINPAVKAISRSLRRNMTPMEKRLWGYIRDRRLAGLRFRRQHPIGRYVADFYCAEHRLVIEIDGDSHRYQAEYDEERTLILQDHGCHVLRFTNEEVRLNIKSVLACIEAYARNIGQE